VALNTIKSNYIYILFLNCTVFISLGNSLRDNNGRKFRTKDSDNNQTFGDCAANKHGAWWFRNYLCGYSSLNGKYLNKAAATAYQPHGIIWHRWKRNWNSLKKTYMMIRRL